MRSDVDLPRRGGIFPQFVLACLGSDENIGIRQQLPKRFYFSDPEIPPLVFLISDWRDTVPRVVIHFGCSNNMVFDSKTMALQQID